MTPRTSPRMASKRRGMTPEQQARVSIDALLKQVGLLVCNMADANTHAKRGMALREFPLNSDYQAQVPK